jgi:uncharacterized protein YjbI with pentapeptide repeats
MDAEVFRKLVIPTEDELVALLKEGRSGAEALMAAAPPARIGYFHTVAPECPRLKGANLDGLDLSGYDFSGLAFENCSFIGAKLNETNIIEATDCDFSKATGDSAQFGRIDRCRFVDANITNAKFHFYLADSDFTAAKLSNCRFLSHYWDKSLSKQPSDVEPKFTKADLHSCVFDRSHIDGANFDDADLSGVAFLNCHLKDASFRNVKAQGALLVGASLPNADFSNAKLTDANLADADLTGAKLDNADLTGANLRGAKLDPHAIKKAKGISASVAVVAGSALTELDSILNTAKTTEISFHVRPHPEDQDVELRISTDSRYSGANAHVAHLDFGMLYDRFPSQPSGIFVFSDVILYLGRTFGHYQVRFETVDVSSSKSPKSGKELRELVMKGIAEAFGQEIPSEEVLAAAAKKHRDAKRDAGSAERERREQAKAEAEKQKEKAKKQIAKKVEKAVGKVTDIATFLKALELRIEKPKIDKATKMLKASGFKLFNDISDQCVSGVVKSQTDPDLVYACRVDHEGHYSCCTQNLNVCGGLRGSICKHLLVLIVGLVQAGELDPTTIDFWIAKTLHVKAELDKENMGAIFIKYKGAEAGEVDWRPTETVPEDYYAL